MPFKVFVVSLLCLWGFSSLQGQEKRSLRPLKTEAEAHIDGLLEDSIWGQVPSSAGFVMYQPGNGNPIPGRFRTEVRVFYTDEALFVGIQCYDSAPDSILKQVTVRDDFNQHNDFVRISINPFNDGQNDFNFYLTAAGVQADSRVAQSEDFSLNSIWYSAVALHDRGWSAEFKIPYIALRFPNEAQKSWGFNVLRSIRRNRHQYTWNLIDRGSGYTEPYQAGLLLGMQDIESPPRISLSPYASTYANRYAGENSYEFNAGLDLKYGLNESFTLDATLIPDFGQVDFDQQFLNLTAFENRFEENRQFFTEGTDLFSLGDLFYSRRIGGTPDNITNQDLSGSDSSIQVSTEFTRLLNATKVSGRTKGNLGIGVLNAVTDNNYLRIDSDSSSRRELLEPLTNYNVVVLDQRINRSSSVSFINTNVLREGSYRDANVAALLASIYLPGGQYRLDSELKRSDILQEGNSNNGYQASLRFGDVDGHWRWATRQEIITEDYDPNDLGFLARGNLLRNYSELEYLTFQPSGPFNRYSLTLFSVLSSLYQPQRYEEFYLGFNSFFLLRDFTGTGIRLRYRPVESYDYFEPRVPGASFKRPRGGAITYFISTDYRKPFAVNLDAYYEYSEIWQRQNWNFDLRPRIRLGEKFFMIPQVIWNQVDKDFGFAIRNRSDGQVFFGQREVRNLTALIEGRWAFDPVRSLGLRLYQNWSRLRYQRFFGLGANGELIPTENLPEQNPDLNFNVLNLDLRFSWWFAPASEMVLLYRVAVSNDNQAVRQNYSRNMDQLFNTPGQNILSLRFSYFLDYHHTRKKLWPKA